MSSTVSEEVLHRGDSQTLVSILLNRRTFFGVLFFFELHCCDVISSHVAVVIYPVNSLKIMLCLTFYIFVSV